MVLGLAQHSVQILNASHDADGHFATFGRSLRARVKSSAESLANLLDAGLELVALEEDDKHRLVHLVTLQKKSRKKVFRKNGDSKNRCCNKTNRDGILQRGVDFSLAKKNVASARTPQHPLECRQTFTQDDTGYESEEKTNNEITWKIKMICKRYRQQRKSTRTSRKK